LGLSILFLSIATGLIAAWLGGRSSRSEASRRGVSAIASDQTLSTGSLWSSTSTWERDFKKIPKGAEIQAISERVAKSGKSLDSRKFWDILDTKAFEKKVFSPGGSLRALQEKIPIDKIIEKLGRFPIESVSTPQSTFSGDWEVLGLTQRGSEMGLLVRYYYEHLDIASLVYSDEWIKSIGKLISIEEYLHVAKDLYCQREYRSETLPIAKQVATDDEFGAMQTIFTPLFGYMVLIFDLSGKEVVCNDVVAIPAEVALSRASGVVFEEDWIAFSRKVAVGNKSVPQGWSPEKTIDVFGEYETSGDDFISKSLVFAENRPDAETTERIERLIPSVTPDRSQQLVRIAQAVTSNYGELKMRVEQFRQSYPQDVGCDALLISLWLRFHDGKRSGMVLENFGTVFLDAAERLSGWTSDAMLFEIKSRIYASHGRIEESNRELDQAQRAGKKSVYMYRRGIEQAIEKGDKLEVLKLLANLNSHWIGQPGVSLASNQQNVLRILSKKWQAESVKQ
jgi:hypothetical protein